MKYKYIILLVAIALFNACNSKQTQKTIRIATLKGPSSIGMIQMIDSLHKLNSYSVNIDIYNEPMLIRKLMLQNEVDFAIVPTTMASILYNKNIQYQLVAIPVWGTLYLFGNDTTINNWADLKGKKVNLMAKGMTPDVLFKHLLIKNGISPNKNLTLDYSFPTHIDLANALASNQCNLGVISEPLVSMVMQKNKKVFPIFDLNNQWQKIYPNIPIAQTSLMVKKEFAQKNTDIVKQVIKHYSNSTQWVNNNPLLASELIVKHKILPNKELASHTIPRSNLLFARADTIKPQILDYLKIFYTMNPNITGGKIPDNNFFWYCEE
ncbi:MAG: ABC transporter substrate-binding protein [Bacteroidales bacterium]|nr:ABC transporter substrate-binding protein [Bacteroidales bacterium]